MGITPSFKAEQVPLNSSYVNIVSIYMQYVMCYIFKWFYEWRDGGKCPLI